MSDPAQRTDGLAMLQGRRAKRTRTIPPSQNPTSLPPYETPTPIIDLNAEEAHQKEVQKEAPKPAPAPKPPKAAPAAASDAPAPVKPGSRKVLYLNEAHEDFMFAVQAAGNALRPRVNLTASAVVRLAMDRLMADMSAEQVRDTIVTKPIDSSALGRPRR